MFHPDIQHLVEAGIYVDDLERAEAFYSDVLGLDVVAKEAERHVFFRVGNSVLLIFLAEESLKGGFLPAHGAKGPGHFALGIPTESLDDWKNRLESAGVEIENSRFSSGASSSACLGSGWPPTTTCWKVDCCRSECLCCCLLR